MTRGALPPNMPSRTLFKQQRLPAWQPIYSPPYVALFLCGLGCLFLPLGIVIHFENEKLLDLEVTYSEERRCSSNDNDGTVTYTTSTGQVTTGCLTSVSFNLEEHKAPVYLYYGLTKFHQNNRNYVRSRSDEQLAGKTGDISLSATKPFATPANRHGGSTVVTIDGTDYTYNDFEYNPAGLGAYSMFNDTFKLYRQTSTGRTLVCGTALFNKATNEPTSPQGCQKKGIAWDSDVKIKYKKPNLQTNQWTASRTLYGETAPTSSNEFYNQGWYANEAGHAIPVTTDEDFMVWMRTASLPNFRKLFRIITEDLPAGTYDMEITELFYVGEFGGTKKFALATTSWIGGKNPYLAYGFMALGAAVFLAAFVFVVLYFCCQTQAQRLMKRMEIQ